MRKIIIFCVIIIPVFSIYAQPVNFDNYFINKTMRFDFFHTGTRNSEIISFDKIKMEPYWSGSKNDLIDKTNFGKYIFKIFDVESNQLLFSQGFCSVFGEWQTTTEAVYNLTRTFHESVLFPFPKKKVKLEIYTRDKANYFKSIYYRIIDPDWILIKKDIKYTNFKVVDIINNGDPDKKVDILILGDGFTKAELPALKKAADEKVDNLFSTEPFKSNKKNFNVRLIESVSEESGIDQPNRNIFKNSILDCSFDAFELDRYVLTYANEKLRDIAANAPYDYICIIANSPIYGGGGIFKLYSISTLDQKRKFFLFVHEFGHQFAGLGDEYFSSAVAYNEFYPTDVEPWEVNLTALHDKKNVKWKGMIPEGTPVPTPDEEKYNNIVGVFEGGGYASKGIFRPFINCIMRTSQVTEFCPVCRSGLQEVIDRYSK
ncbi:M64 family metallopeptidase [candidate division KSB1 bacterium]